MNVLSAVSLTFLQPAWHSSCRKCRLSPGTLSEMRRATATPQVGLGPSSCRIIKRSDNDVTERSVVLQKAVMRV